MSHPPDRRSLLVGAALIAFPAYALLAEAATEARLDSRRWIDRHDELARGLRAGTITPSAWRDEVARLAAGIDIAQLLAEVGRAKSTTTTPFMRDPVKRTVHFVDETGQPRRFDYAAALFSFGADNVITPHAHRYMASAHLVVSGRVRIRTFDRVAETEGAIVIRPTGDRVAEPGDAATMTADRDNVHWFTPVTRRAETFDVIVDGLEPGRERYRIEPVDPLGGEHRADGTIVAPRLDLAESMRRYSAAL